MYLSARHWLWCKRKSSWPINLSGVFQYLRFRLLGASLADNQTIGTSTLNTVFYAMKSIPPSSHSDGPCSPPWHFFMCSGGWFSIPGRNCRQLDSLSWRMRNLFQTHSTTIARFQLRSSALEARIRCSIRTGTMGPLTVGETQLCSKLWIVGISIKTSQTTSSRRISQTSGRPRMTVSWSAQTAVSVKLTGVFFGDLGVIGIWPNLKSERLIMKTKPNIRSSARQGWQLIRMVFLLLIHLLLHVKVRWQLDRVTPLAIHFDLSSSYHVSFVACWTTWYSASQYKIKYIRSLLIIIQQPICQSYIWLGSETPMHAPSEAY